MNKSNSKHKEEKLVSFSDEALMKLFVLDNNELAFELVYSRYFNSLTKYIGWLSKDIDLSKDIVQTIFSKLYSNPDLYQLGKKFKPWIYTATKNRLTNHWRDDKNRNRIIKESLFLTDEAFLDEDKSSKMRQITEALECLSDNHKEIFVLKYSSNLTIKEIAEISNCSEGTVKSRLFYAMKKLKEIMNVKNK